MRVIVLVILGGAVLYVVLNGFGSDSEEPEPSVVDEAAQTQDEGPGRMRTPAEIEAQLAQAEIGAAEGTGEVPPLHAAPPAEPSTPRPEAGEPSLVLDWDTGDPVEQGALLVHDVESLPAMLSGPWADLPEPRKQLLFGYGLLVRGQREPAREVLERIGDSPQVSPAELALLRGVVEGGRPQALPASSREGPLVLGARMALLAQEAEGELREEQYARAATTLSSLLLQEIDAPWAADAGTLERWSTQLAEAQSMHRWSKTGSWPSFDVEVMDNDSLVAVRKRVIGAHPEMHLCTGLIERANQLGRYVHPGDVLRIPTDPVRTLVDLSSRWMFYLHGDEVVGAWQVAVGREDAATRPGDYVVGVKLPEPPWFKPGSEPVPYGHPDNPLGTRWIAWDGSNGLGFHGTWAPETLGSAASDGCIRLRNADVEELFEILPQGSPIRVRP